MADRDGGPDSSSARGMATEYVVLLVLVMIGAILLYAKFGTSVGRKANEAGGKVAELNVEGAGRGAPPAAGGGGVAGGADGEGGVASDEEPAPLPEDIDTGASGSAEGPDTRTVVLLGIGVVAVGALMIVAIAQRIRKDTKKQRRV